MNNLTEIFDKFKDLDVLIIGDIMLDSYIYGDVDRVSPEAPVPILNKTKEEYKLGGAGNVALNCNALGANSSIISYIGDDQYGETVKILLEEHNIDNHLLVNGKPTTVKQRIISGNTHLLRVDIEDISDYQDYQEQLLRKIQEIIMNFDVLILSDYNKGVLTEGNIQDIIDLATDFDVTVVVDPKKKNFLNYVNVDLFKPNLKEAIEGLGLSNKSSVKDVSEKLRSKLNAKSVMITLSGDGIYYSGDDMFLSDSYPVELADPCGCGDTVVSVTSLLKHLVVDEELMVSIANVSGSMVCEHIGVVQVSNKDLLERCIKLGL